MTDLDDTIFAVATGRGGSIAIMRVSGSETGRILDELCGGVPAPRRAALRTISDGRGVRLDRGLVLWFPGPHSYTGEDAAELHLHAGPAILDALADALLRTGARPAERGEFTRRAFMTGRIDLLEAEGIADLIAAETEEQRRQALAQAEGGLSDLTRQWTREAAELLALQEAAIDFPDEAVTHDRIDDRTRILALADTLERQADDGRQGERLRDGLTIVIAGAPNVGKSSIMNRLAGRDVAIVSDRPGTTRDRVDARCVIAGVPVTLVDTAGLRAASDPIEAEGVRRAREACAGADLVIMVRTAEIGVDDTERPDVRQLRVVNKIDRTPHSTDQLGISARTGEGFDALWSRLDAEVIRLARRRDTPALTRARHRAALTDARAHLLTAADQPVAELRGEDLRQAVRALGRLTGSVGVEDVLDMIFSSFCIGK